MGNQLATGHVKPKATAIPIENVTEEIEEKPAVKPAVEKEESVVREVELGSIHNQEKIARAESEEQAATESEALKLYNRTEADEQVVRETKPSKFIVPPPISVEKELPDEESPTGSAETGVEDETGTTGATGVLDYTANTGITGSTGSTGPVESHASGASGVTGSTG